MPQKETVLKVVHDESIPRIWLWFTDILGQLKGVEIPPSELEKALEEGMGFDGSSIEGFARIEESDLMAIPDPSSFSVYRDPATGRPRSAQIFCDLFEPDGSPYKGDPRRVLRNNLKKLDEKGYCFHVGPEMEYFYLQSPHDPVGFDQTGYFDASMINRGTDLRRRTVTALQGMGVHCEYSHHEVAASQHEIDVHHGDALRMADTVMTIRYLVKEIATEAGAYATFMPKPFYGKNGSGMHVHQSIFEGKQNLFFDENDPYHLSTFAQHYVAGILRHIREITAVLNQWVNSYKRLVLGYEAPAYVSWGQKNRSALVRVPRYRPGKHNASRVEVRSPDPVCNPYLAFSVMLAAGLKGVENQYPLPDPIEMDLFRMSDSERNAFGVKTLPGNLHEAIQVAQESELLRQTLGEHVFSKFIENKKIEWDQYRTQVTDYELRTYLPIL
ncbi:MAG: glutamine synthetase [Deltaproteobacteria bacterium]|nr:glutamine synthetase [Deltaproteobacteria bacterium]